MPAFKEMVEKFDLAPTRIVLGVNDSTDDTWDQVSKWNHPVGDAFYFETGVSYPNRVESGNRAAHLAAVRNRVIDRALGYADWDYALMLDAAKMTAPEIPRLLIEDGGDIVAPLSWHWKYPTIFYDTWCFRDIHGNRLENRLRFPKEPRVEVTAVGGVYIVKRSIFERGCRLAGTDGTACDSVPLCEQARSAGFHVYVRTDLHVTAFDYPHAVPRLGCVNCFMPAGDYVSPNFSRFRPDHCFPYMAVGDTRLCAWPYLRRDIPHNWYVDSRKPTIGFLNRDEAHILYNNALPFRGKQALEIGCWVGWSAVHLAATGVVLDVIDPMLGVAQIDETVRSSLTAGGLMGNVNLIAGSSPEKVEELAATGKRWSLMFIDGNHEKPGPYLDAVVCAKFAEPDAMILFHDLAAPAVAEGLDYLREQGWNTLVYCTAQVMGVAWRGNVTPVKHIPDPRISWTLPEHLRPHPVSGARERQPPAQRVEI